MLPDRNRRIAAVALGASARDGFALGGGSALVFHGVTRGGLGNKVIDLVTDRDNGRDVPGAVETALRRAGYRPERLDQTAELQGALPRKEGTLAQFRVPTAGGHDHPPRPGLGAYTCGKCIQRVYLELGRGPRSRDPVVTDAGPVLDVEDAAGQQVRDLVGRGRVRDFAVTADLLERWSPAQLIGFARRLDPGLAGRDLSRVAARLATLPEVAFTGLGLLRPQDVPRLRERFADWSRGARDADRAQPGQQRENADPGREKDGRPAAERERPEPAPPARPPRCRRSAARSSPNCTSPGAPSPRPPRCWVSRRAPSSPAPATGWPHCSWRWPQARQAAIPVGGRRDERHDRQRGRPGPQPGDGDHRAI
jgi:hypothetical protein